MPALSMVVVRRPVASNSFSGPLNLNFDGAMPMWLLLAYPNLTAIMGAVYFAFLTWLYNLLARWIAPISIELSE